MKQKQSPQKQIHTEIKPAIQLRQRHKPVGKGQVASGDRSTVYGKKLKWVPTSYRSNPKFQAE